MRGLCIKPNQHYDPCDPLARECPEGFHCSGVSRRCLNSEEVKKVLETDLECKYDWQCSYQQFCQSEKCAARLEYGARCHVPTDDLLAQKQGDWYDDECKNGLVCVPNKTQQDLTIGICQHRCNLDSECTGGGIKCLKFSQLIDIKACLEQAKGEGRNTFHIRDYLKNDSESTATQQQPAQQAKETPFYYQTDTMVIIGGIMGCIIFVILAVILYLCFRKKGDGVDEFMEDLEKPWWERGRKKRGQKQNTAEA